MKSLKKMMALVIAAVMVLGMTNMAWADDPADGVTTNNYTLTINNTVEDHVYTAYQIFKGSKADTSQVAYTELASGATYDAKTTYYYKNGEDYDVDTTINSAETFGAAKSAHQLYTRTGSSSLGQVSWGDDITDAGKVALYAAYNITDKDGNAFTTSSTDLNDAAKVQALVDAIANPTDTATSESDKAVKFSEVFFTTETDGDVTPITTPEARLKDPAATQIKKATDSGSVSYTGLPSGYYLVNDSYTPKTNADGYTEVNGIDYSIARIAVQVVGNTTINNKADKTVVKKKIKTSAELINEKANELGIGRVVEYEVTEVVPNYTQYNYYYFDMRDKMDAGLTFNPASVKVTVDGTEISKLEAPNHSQNGQGYYLYTEGAPLTANGNSSTFVLAFENIMKFRVGAPIVVTYTANVNSNAITGVDPNKNEVKVDYSNDPKTSEKHDIDDDHPGVPAYDQNTPTGTTPKSFTNTYTTEITILKVDEDGTTPLENVEFVLTGKSKEVVLKTDTVYELDDDGDYYMLKDGTYTDTAPQNEATLRETQENSGWVEMVTGDTYDGDDIRVIGTKKYRPFVNGKDNALTRYVIVEGNAATYASTTLRYSPVTKSTLTNPAETEEYEVAMTGKTDSNGKLVFSQLGAGEYNLAETVVLPGYNDIEDITFKITCTVPDAAKVIAGTEEATWNVSDTTPAGTVISQVQEDVPGANPGDPTTKKNTGKFEIKIENHKGTELPSTGGIGTTIFYALGGILLVAAGILLVSKRRAY